MNLIDKALAVSLSFTPINPNTTTSSWQGLVNTVATWIFAIAGVVAFFYLIYSGFLYLTAAGNPDAAKKGQQGIINAIIGLIIIFLAFAIVRAVTSLLSTTA
jgi:hypothetical protein